MQIEGDTLVADMWTATSACGNAHRPLQKSAKPDRPSVRLWQVRSMSNLFLRAQRMAMLQTTTIPSSGST